MIYDCFTFFNEIDLLKIRCEELKSLNLVHVLVESPYTFTGKEKPLYFNERKTEFSEYAILHIISDFIPDKNAWTNEKNQRNSILSGLIGAKENDTIFIGDADEVPFAKTLSEFNPNLNIAALKMNKTGYWLNCIEGYECWDRAKIMTWNFLKDKTPEEIRNTGYDNVTQNAGWHFSWLGDEKILKQKLKSFSHTECDTPELNDKLAYKIETGQSLWGDDYWKIIPIDESFPKYVQEHQHDSLKHLIKQI